MNGPDKKQRDERARQIAEHMLSQEGTGPAWGIEILEARQGYARISMRVTPAMLNGHGTAHGGMIFALADTAFAYACNSRNETSVAQSATIIFLAPGAPGRRAHCRGRRAGRERARSGAYAVRRADGRWAHHCRVPGRLAHHRRHYFAGCSGAAEGLNMRPTGSTFARDRYVPGSLIDRAVGLSYICG
ncbi:MAG: hotdog fold thioesterase [Alphaproteobacteria bacterium]